MATMDFTPSYHRIKQDITRSIRAGKLSPGSRVQSIRKLAADYEVSYETAARAIRELTREGLLVTRRGSGTFVSEMHPAPARTICIQEPHLAAPRLLLEKAR